MSKSGGKTLLMGALSHLHLVFIGYVWPEPVSSAAGVRTVALVNHALSSGARVTFLSPSKRNRFSEALDALGVSTYEIAANDSAFDELILKLTPDAVIFDRFVLEEQFGWRVFSNCPAALRVVDTQDLHFLRKARERATLESKAIDFSSEEVLRELSSVYRSHKTLVVSDHEMALLKEQFDLPEDRAVYLPLCFQEAAAVLPNFHERRGFLFLGNFRHSPNLDGALWFLREVFPRIRARLPQAEVHLYGAYPPKEIAAAHSPESGVFAHGLASEGLAELRHYRVNLAPLRFGAGIKGKIADGWRFGLPCVATDVGAEGMRLGNEFGGIVAGDAEVFAGACVALHEEESLWKNCASAGAQTLKRRFSPEENSRLFIELIDGGIRNRTEIERRNTLGKILWWNQHRSTEFMSRWIEAKNKI